MPSSYTLGTHYETFVRDLVEGGRYATASEVLRDNPLGVMREWWFHRAGCGLWFIAERHTKTHEIQATYAWSKGPS